MKNKDLEAMSGKTDERKQGEWKSRYPEKKARIFQALEAIYIFSIVVISFVAILLNYVGLIPKWLNINVEGYGAFSGVFTCSICGLLGGAIFDMKWFYKSIAHGFWNRDRIYWRLFTPIISLSFAFCLACVFNENIITYGNGFSAATLGFLSGYFSDEAVGKMAEVAKVLFNTTSKSADKVKPDEFDEENK